MMRMNPFLIIIPAYNEGKNIGRVIEGLLGLRLRADILIINDGSVDETLEIALSYPVSVVSHPYNMGYGTALQTGFKYASRHQYSYLIQFDADGQHDPRDVLQIIEELQRGGADIVLGSRYLGISGEIRVGPLKKLAVLFFRWIIFRITGVQISDPTSGLRGISHLVFNYYALRNRFPADFPDADVLIHMILRDFRVREIPVHMRNRMAGESMHSGLKPLFYFVKILLSISIVVMRHKLKKLVTIHE